MQPDGPIVVSHHISPNITDPKRPYGGLVPSQPKGQRAYYDAAAYNHTLAQHQAYTAQAQAANQAASATRNNPYMVPHPPQAPQAPPSAASYQNTPDVNVVSYQPQQHHSHPHAHTQYGGQNANRALSHQNSTGQLTNNAGVGSAMGQYGATPAHGGTNQSHLSPASGPGSAPGSGSYYPNSRARANTINQMDAVPPALARLQHMNQDVIGGRNALTPVLNRDDAMREWERRQQGGKPAQVQPYPQLEYLQQQAEMAAAAGGLGGWAATAAAAAALGIHPHGPGHNHRYPPPPSKLSHSYPAQTSLVDDDSSRRDAILSNVRSAARDGRPGGPGSQQSQQQQPPPSSAGGAQQGPPPPPQGSGMYGTASGGGAMTSISISNLPQAYNSAMNVTGNRFAATYGVQAPPPPSSGQQQHPSQGGNPGANGGGGPNGGADAGGVSAFDSIDRRTDIGSMFVPMQPDTYHHQHPQHSHQYPGPGGTGPQGPPRHVVAPPQQAVPTSFYGAGVVPTGAPPPPSQSGQQGPPLPGQGQGQQGQQGGQQRNPFTSMPVADTSMGGIGKDVRRGNGMDAWPR